MAAKDLTVQIDEETLEKLNELARNFKVNFNCIVNEALKYYLVGRVASGQRTDASRAASPAR